MEKDLRHPEPPTRRGRLLAGLGLLVFVLAACAENAPQDVLDPAGPIARKQDDLWNLVFPIAVAVFVIVEGLLVYALIKFRHREGREAKQFHGNTKAEVALTVIPALILAGIAIPTVSTVLSQAEKPPGALDITVIGHQFWWEYQYPDEGIVTANELVIPTDKEIYLTLDGNTTDLVDGTNEVIHSYWIPRLAGKQDIIPGRITNLRIRADEPGTYRGQCTEFCGLGHAYMRHRAIAMEPADFDQWVEDQQAPAAEDSSASAGAELFQQGQFANGPPCASCHALDTGLEDPPQPQTLAGPNLAHFASRTTFAAGLFERTDANLKAWLAGPGDVKPGAKMPDLGLTEEQIDDLVAYLQSLE
jgi:cytochrome c oxidase subunit II